MTSLVPYGFERKAPAQDEVLIDILYCGVCHADIHQSKNEYGGTTYPLVPGHEIVGRVKSVSQDVTKFKVNDLVGVGYFIDSCRRCGSCTEHEEQYCEDGITPTQNGKLADGTTTKGGYSDSLVVKEAYVLRIDDTLDPAGMAPLLCAGITAYSPLKHWEIGAGHKVAVLGLGGVGHMAVKFASSFGAEVTVLSGSPSKKDGALNLGAADFILTSDAAAMKRARSTFDFLIDTVSARHDYNTCLNLLKKDGTMILLGVPPKAPQMAAYPLISKRRKMAGSLIGSIRETQQMLDYCAEKNIAAEVEVIPPAYINEAFERTLKGDVHYRFVIDIKKL
jgi:uncharacterized zinc-type alcohol dehydrogenase-like protein